MKRNTDRLQSQRMIHTAAISLAVFIMLFAITCGLFGIGSHEESLTMDDSMHIVIHRNDGSTDTYRRPYFSPVRKGETMEVTVPAVKDKGSRHAALTFVLYHCEVQAYCGNERIYVQEPLKKGQQTLYDVRKHDLRGYRIRISRK